MNLYTMSNNSLAAHRLDLQLVSRISWLYHLNQEDGLRFERGLAVCLVRKLFNATFGFFLSFRAIAFVLGLVLIVIGQRFP